MNTWEHNSPGDIVISGDSYVIREYCTNTNENWDCIERLQVIPYESLKQQSLVNTESYSNTAVFVIVIMLLMWFVKWIFRLILPTRWKK